MKIVVLGKGLAGTVFHVVSSHLLQGKNDLKVIYKESLPLQEKGLRYLHPPLDSDIIKIGKYTNNAECMWQYFKEELQFQHVDLTKELNWAIMKEGGSIYVVDDAMPLKDIMDITRVYAELNYRQLEHNIMNGLRKGHRRALASLLPYNKIISKLNIESEAFEAAGEGKLIQAEVNSIDLESQKIYAGEHVIKYDFLINTLPLPTLISLIKNVKIATTKFKYSPSIYVKSDTVMKTKLDYYYNIWKTKVADFQLSRVVFKQNGIDFEYSVDPKTNRLCNVTGIKNILRNDVMKHLRVLYRIFSSELSCKNFESIEINQYSHFYETEDIKKIIKNLEKYDIISLGRYAQWQHSIKLAEIWSRSVEICKKLSDYKGIKNEN